MWVERGRIGIGWFEKNSWPVQNPLQPVVQPIGRGTIPSLMKVLNNLSMKQDITLQEFRYLWTVMDTTEGLTNPILQEYASSALSDWTLTQYKKLFFSKNVEVEQGPVLPCFFCCLVESVWVPFISQRVCLYTFSLPQPESPIY